MDFSVSTEELRRHKGDVFPLVREGKTVWVKKRRRPEAPLLRLAQRLIYAATRFPLAVPPGPAPENNVAFEAERLRQAREKGIPVPAVLHLDERYCVLEDAGTPLHSYLKARPEEAEALIGRAAEALRRLHDRGLAHGGTQLKNITVRDGRILFIDLEENIPGDRLELFQLRDLFLFLFSLEKNGYNPDLRRICAAYGAERGGEVPERLAGALRRFRPLRLVNAGCFDRWTLRDIRPLAALAGKADRDANRDANRHHD